MKARKSLDVIAASGTEGNEAILGAANGDLVGRKFELTGERLVHLSRPFNDFGAEHVMQLACRVGRNEYLHRVAGQDKV